MTIFALLFLILILLLPGLPVWLIVSQEAKLSGLETVFVCLLAGTAVTSWLSLTLAEFSLFSLPLLLILVLFFSGLGLGWAIRHKRLRAAWAGLRWQWQDGIVAVLLLVGILLSGRPSEYIIGGRDHGVYVNTGIHIAKTGGIVVQDAAITAVFPELRPVIVWPETRTQQAGFPGPWSEGQRMSGLTIRDLDAGIYLPHAFHLYPALIAVFFAVGGVPLALFTTMFLALLGSLAIYLTVARLWSRAVALLTLLLLTFSVTQVWFTGYPTAEIMVQVFFFGGLLSLVLLLDNGGLGTAVLTGTCFGLLHLAKLDTVLISVAVGAIFLYFWLRRPFQPVYWWAVGAYLLLSLQAALHAIFVATTYFLDHAVRTLLPAFLADRLVAAAAGHPYPADWLGRFFTANWPLLLLAGLILLAGLGLLHWLRPSLGRLLGRLLRQPQRWQQGIAVGLLLVMVGTAVLNQFATTTALNGAVQAAHLSRLYLTRAGLLIGILGILLLIYQANSTAQRVALFLLAGNVAPFYLLGAGTSPDHFWVIRRFMPIAFPTFLLAMATLVWYVWRLRPQQWAKARWPLQMVAVGLLLVILAGFLQHIRYITRVVEYDGLTAQLGALAEQLPDKAILLIQTGTPAQQFSLPLWFLFDKSVFSIRGEVKEDVGWATAVAHWQRNGQPVYWLATDQTPPPQWPNWQQTLQFSYLINVPEMERPLDRIPHQLQQLQMPLDVYALTEQ